MVRPMALGRLVRLSMKTTNTASDLASILDFHEDASGRFKGKLEQLEQIQQQSMQCGVSGEVLDAIGRARGATMKPSTLKHPLHGLNLLRCWCGRWVSGEIRRRRPEDSGTSAPMTGMPAWSLRPRGWT